MQNELSPPVLTVVIPNHNYGRWVSEAINSVAIDPYPYKNIMVVDDGSTDNSWQVINELAGLKVKQPEENTIYTGQVANVPFFAYRFPQAGGPSRARNLAIQALWNRTHLFGFLDADDIYLPGKIMKSVEIFMQQPNKIGAVYTDYDTLDINTGLKHRQYKPVFSREALLRECIVHSACIVNKLALHDCGLYDNELICCEDYDLWCRISEKFIIVHIPESLMMVRVHMQNSSNVLGKETWQKCHQRVFQKIVERQNSAN